MNPLIHIETEGVLAASAASAALAGQAAGSTGLAAGAGAVVPPGLDPDISPLNVASIMAFTTQAAALLGTAATFQEMYAAASSLSSTTYTLTDLLAAAGIDAVT